MKKLLLPLLLALIGGGAGVGAGIFLGGGSSSGVEEAEAADHGAAPEEGHGEAGAEDGQGEETPAGDHGEGASDHAAAGGEDGEASGGGFEYVKLPQQFVVPVIEGSKVRALVVVSLSLEVEQGATQSVFSVEPKLRDAFLEAMFTHAHSGGFDGNFTTGTAMADFRLALNAAATEVLGDMVHDVLVTDIIRQDS
jgi:hypothetical protein